MLNVHLLVDPDDSDLMAPFQKISVPGQPFLPDPQKWQWWSLVNIFRVQQLFRCREAGEWAVLLREGQDQGRSWSCHLNKWNGGDDQRRWWEREWRWRNQKEHQGEYWNPQRRGSGLTWKEDRQASKQEKKWGDRLRRAGWWQAGNRSQLWWGRERIHNGEHPVQREHPGRWMLFGSERQRWRNWAFPTF